MRAYHPLIHKVRPHVGQQVVAARVRTLLQPENPSELWQSHQYKGKVQDAYSLRCVPQVHGIVNDTINFVKGILTTELNCATDNPMVFTAEQVANEIPFGFDIKIANPDDDDKDSFTKGLTKKYVPPQPSASLGAGCERFSRPRRGHLRGVSPRQPPRLRLRRGV